MTVNPERVQPETDVENELGPDSLEKVEIVMGLETEFDLNLGDDTTEFGAIRDIVRRIDTELAGREMQTL
jgi:acyl carrier protein